MRSLDLGCLPEVGEGGLCGEQKLGACWGRQRATNLLFGGTMTFNVCGVNDWGSVWFGDGWGLLRVL